MIRTLLAIAILLAVAAFGVWLNHQPADVDGCCPHIDPTDDEGVES